MLARELPAVRRDARGDRDRLQRRGRAPGAVLRVLDRRPAARRDRARAARAAQAARVLEQAGPDNWWTTPSEAIERQLSLADLVVDVSGGGLFHAGQDEILATGTRILRAREPLRRLEALFPDAAGDRACAAQRRAAGRLAIDALHLAVGHRPARRHRRPAGHGPVRLHRHPRTLGPLRHRAGGARPRRGRGRRRVRAGARRRRVLHRHRRALRDRAAAGPLPRGRDRVDHAAGSRPRCWRS